jgi:hypothetical protein
VVILLLLAYIIDVVFMRLTVYGSGKYYILKKDVKIVNPESKSIVGLLKKGMIIKTPSFFDIDDFRSKVKLKLLILPDRYRDQYNLLSRLPDKELQTIAKYRLTPNR